MQCCSLPRLKEPKTDKDEEYCRKVNEYLNNPPIPGALGSGGSGSHELSALGGELSKKNVDEIRQYSHYHYLITHNVYFLLEGGLQNLLGNMSHNQLMQLIGPTGLGGLGEKNDRMTVQQIVLSHYIISSYLFIFPEIAFLAVALH